MMKLGTSTLLLFVWAALGCASGCERQSTVEPPGTVLGSFHAKALLTSSDCGAGVEAPEEYEFSCVLSADETAIYWTQNDNTLVGSLDESEATWSAHASAEVGPACTLQRSDSVKARLNDVSAPTKLIGTLAYAFLATTGTDCRSQTVAAGGTFENIPCTIGYTFSANEE